MRKNKKAGYGGGMDPDGDETPGSGGYGGMASIKQNARAALGRGHALPTAPPLAASAKRSWWDLLRDAPEVPTGAQPHDLPGAPYGPVEQPPLRPDGFSEVQV